MPLYSNLRNRLFVGNDLAHIMKPIPLASRVECKFRRLPNVGGGNRVI